MALDEKCDLFTLLLPHLRREVRLRIDNLIITIVNKEPSFLHLHSELSHHDGRFSLVLVSLYLTFVLFWVIVSCLISL